MKKCTKCGDVKPLYCFYYRKGRGAYESRCKSCLLEDQSIYRDNNREFIRASGRKSYAKDPKKKIEYQKLYRQKNKEVYNKKRREYCKKRYRTDAIFRLKSNVSGALYKSLSDKTSSTCDYLELFGYSIIELKTHLEKQFSKDMSWDNYGNGVDKWNIDHITPQSKFNLSKEVELISCWSLPNLRPLWSCENSSKNNKVTHLL